MPLKIKVPVSEIQKSDVRNKIEQILQEDSENAYTIMGLMVKGFNVKEQDVLNKPFSQWKKGLPTLYTRVRTTLEKLIREGKVKKAKHEKAFVYWWVEK